MAVVMLAAKIVAVLVVFVMISYMLRHYLFALSRLFHRQRLNYSDLSGFHLPSISILIPMHNEEAVAPDVIEALLEADYPHDGNRLEIIPINDHSTDRTGEILDEYARRHSFIKPLHRTEGLRGKPAGLKDATRLAKGEVLVVFDADYIPGKALLKFLAAPFVDPEVGAVMGRVVPHNVGASLLTRLLDLERAGGYQINQQARYNLGLIPQFGGTVGGVRRTALEAVGGWNTNSLTEDTDLTLQLAIHGWKIAYVNRAECYEEVPENWRARRGQIERWAVGHTDCMHRFLGGLLRSQFLDWKTKLDGALMLGVYLSAPLLLIGWLACTVLFFGGQSFLPALAAFFIASTAYNAMGNFASFFEIGSSVILDGAHRRVRLLPLNIANFVFSTATVSWALLRYYTNRLRGRDPGSRWVKTERFRNGGNGGKGGNGQVNGGNGNGSRGLGTARNGNGNSRPSPAIPNSRFLSLFTAVEYPAGSQVSGQPAIPPANADAVGQRNGFGQGRGLNYLRASAGINRETEAIAAGATRHSDSNGLRPTVAENGNLPSIAFPNGDGRAIHYLRANGGGHSGGLKGNEAGRRNETGVHDFHQAAVDTEEAPQLSDEFSALDPDLECNRN